MKITIETPQAGEEEQIIIKAHHLTPEIFNMLNAFKSGGAMLIANIGSEIHRINPADIFYIETVDNKTFLYGEGKVYESKQKLYELDALSLTDFLRISKSTIINLSKIQSLVPSISGRLEAVLAGGERVVISRQYVSALKKNLGI